MSELTELIEIARNIERQNDEIIRLLSKIADEKDTEEPAKDRPVMDFGELYLSDDSFSNVQKEPEEIENRWRIGSLLDNEIDVGEVYFIDAGDIYKLTIENNETSLDNLTGDGEPDAFNLQEMIANESISNNASLDDGTVILSMEQSQNLPETLKLCVEQGAKKVYMPLFASAQLVGAPQFLMELVKLDFYKNDENLVEKLFK